MPPNLDQDSSSPSNQTAIEGQPIYINCPISGKPTPRILWLKDGEPLSVERDPNIRVLADGRRLEISAARITDRGRYTCVGQSVAGELAKHHDVTIYGKGHAVASLHTYSFLDKEDSLS